MAVSTTSFIPNLAVYYGQGPNQNQLGTFCTDNVIDIIPLAFLDEFPDQTSDGFPVTNFGNQCGVYWTNPATGEQTGMMNDCSQLIDGIQTCQAQGTKIFISLGGALPGNNNLASAESATNFANYLWDTFGPLPSNFNGSNYARPFGPEVVDGFDFDIESGSPNYYDVMIDQLRTNFETDTTKSYYISSAPSCSVPDVHLDVAIQNSWMDYIFIQSYNSPSCSASSYFDQSSGNNISYAKWVNYVQGISGANTNPNVKLYLGLPASDNAANSASYVLTVPQAKTLATALANEFPNQFGGIMLYEATYSEENTAYNGQSYAYNMKQILNSINSGTTTTTTTTAQTTTSTTRSTTAVITTTSSSTTTKPATTTTSSSTTPTLTTTTTTSSKPTTTPSTTSSSPAAITTSSSSAAATTTSSTTSAATTMSSSSTSASTTTSSSSAVTTSSSLSTTASTTASSQTTTSSTTAPATTTSSGSTGGSIPPGTTFNIQATTQPNGKFLRRSDSHHHHHAHQHLHRQAAGPFIYFPDGSTDAELSVSSNQATSFTLDNNGNLLDVSGSVVYVDTEVGTALYAPFSLIAAPPSGAPTWMVGSDNTLTLSNANEYVCYEAANDDVYFILNGVSISTECTAITLKAVNIGGSLSTTSSTTSSSSTTTASTTASTTALTTSSSSSSASTTAGAVSTAQTSSTTSTPGSTSSTSSVSTSSSTWTTWTSTSSSTSVAISPILQSTTSTTSSSSLQSSTWTSTSSSSIAVSPILQSTTSTATSSWLWTSTSTSVPISPISTMTTSTTANPSSWLDWTSATSSSTSSFPISPVSQTTTSSTPYVWSSTSTSVVYDPTITSTASLVWADWPQTTTITVTTTYTDLCTAGAHSGELTVYPWTTTITTVIPAKPTATGAQTTPAAPVVTIPVAPNGVPQGWTTTIRTVATIGVTNTVTLTIPLPSGGVKTLTIVPEVSPVAAVSGDGSWSSAASTASGSMAVSPAAASPSGAVAAFSVAWAAGSGTNVAPVQTSSSVAWAAGSSTNVAPVQTSPVSTNVVGAQGTATSAWAYPSSAASSAKSGTEVAPAATSASASAWGGNDGSPFNAPQTFTGDAGRDLPATVMSVAVCVGLAVVGLFI